MTTPHGHPFPMDTASAKMQPQPTEMGRRLLATDPTRDTERKDRPMHADDTRHAAIPSTPTTTEPHTIEEVLVGFSPGASYHFEVNVHPLDQPDPYFEVDVYRDGRRVGWAQERTLELAIMRAIAAAAKGGAS